MSICLGICTSFVVYIYETNKVMNYYRVREILDRATGIWGVKNFSDLNTFRLVKCNVIGTAKEGTCWLYCTWVILNKSGRKINWEGVNSR